MPLSLNDVVHPEGRDGVSRSIYPSYALVLTLGSLRAVTLIRGKDVHLEDFGPNWFADNNKRWYTAYSQLQGWISWLQLDC